MLKLHGVDVNPDGCNTVRDPTLLMEQMEHREALAQAATREAVDAIATRTRAELEQGFGTTAKAFAENDLERAEVEITRLKYLSKLLDETRVRRAKLAAAGGQR